MEQNALETVKTFDESSLPELDVVVMAALELFSEAELPLIDMSDCTHPLVLGSGNAEATGRILFKDHDAIYADESTYKEKIESSRGGIKHAVVISASGKKHAVEITKDLTEKGISVWLFTNNPEAPAAEFVSSDKIKIFPRNREPYTYNTSTYMSMILGKTKEDTKSIKSFIENEVEPKIPQNFSQYDSFYFMLPPDLYGLRDMLLTKFDELFGSKVSARVFTFEQTKHAKTVVPSDTEMYISFGDANDTFGLPKNRLDIPLLENGDYAAAMAVTYFVIGHIQKQHPSYFKDNISRYMEEARELFGSNLSVVTG